MKGFILWLLKEVKNLFKEVLIVNTIVVAVIAIFVVTEVYFPDCSDVLFFSTILIAPLIISILITFFFG